MLFTNNCQTKPDYELLADQIHSEIISVDSHTDTPLRLSRGNFDISIRNDARKTRSKFDLPRMEEGRLDAVFLAAFVGQARRTELGYRKAKERADHLIDIIYEQAAQNDDKVVMKFDSDSLYEIKQSGKKMFFIGIENGFPIGKELGLIDEYYKKGVRYITLCHTLNNDICDSSNDTLEHNGLSKFGEQVVGRMNELGMMVDVSHASDKTFYDVIKISKAPVIASHSCVKSLCDNPRNVTDDMLKTIAENNGVIQITLYTGYIKESGKNELRDKAYKAWREKYQNFDSLSDSLKKLAMDERAELNTKYPRNYATVQDFADHIDHAVKVAGINHVGIGSDFDGGGGIAGCNDVSELKNITIELLKRGYTKEDLRKIWGGNFFRVMRDVEKIATKL